MIKQYQLIGLRLASILGGLELPSIKREEGQTMAEYALILAGIAVAVVLVITLLGGKISGIFSSISSAL